MGDNNDMCLAFPNSNNGFPIYSATALQIRSTEKITWWNPNFMQLLKEQNCFGSVIAKHKGYRK